MVTCGNGGTCVDTQRMGFQCMCASEYYGETCENSKIQEYRLLLFVLLSVISDILFFNEYSHNIKQLLKQMLFYVEYCDGIRSTYLFILILYNVTYQLL